jgi:hypothetical protein
MGKVVTRRKYDTLQLAGYGYSVFFQKSLEKPEVKHGENGLSFFKTLSVFYISLPAYGVD